MQLYPVFTEFRCFNVMLH